MLKPGATRIVACLGALMLTLLATVWSASGRAEILDEIRERGYVTFGVKADYRPFGFRDRQGNLVGYDVDVAYGFARVLGVTPRFVPVSSANRLQKLQRGEVDVVVATLGDTRSRRKLVHMVEPQYYGDGANVLLRTDSRITTWEGLRGQTLCSLQGSLWNRLAAERLLIDTVSLATTREALLALRNRHCVGWLYDEVKLLGELQSGDWDGYNVSLPTRFVLPWAVAIAKDHAGSQLDRILGDTLAEWHRSGFLQELEKRWELPPSPYLRDTRAKFSARHETGEPLCERSESGQWPIECRETGLVAAQELSGVSGLTLKLMEWTGLDISVLYDPVDRTVFLFGLGLTFALSVFTVIGSLLLGILFGWIIHRRLLLLAPLLRWLCIGLRMTPPLLQLYVVFFGLGGVLLALGLTVDAFTVSALVLSLYAASSNAVAYSLAADVAARDRSLTLSPPDIRRVWRLCHAALMGNSVNIVKATGMASTLALPELVHASTAIVAEKGNDDVMMNLLLLSYFLMVFLTVMVFHRLGRQSA